MTHDNEYMERLLAEHAAAKDCGLLADGPTGTERSRLASEIDRVSGVEACLEKSVRPRSRHAWLVGAAAAALVLAIGLWALRGGRGQPKTPEGGAIVQDNVPRKEQPHVEFLNGRGRLVPGGKDTRYTLVDAARGRVRLDQGQLFVSLPASEDLQADIETPAGTATATALETSFYAHCGETPEMPGHTLLAVAVVDGFVEVRNPQGRAIAGAGEVVLADAGSAPKRHSRSPLLGIATPPERGWWRFGNVLGMLHRPDVQTELKLTEEQKARLHKPTGNNWREIGMFFRDVYSVPPDERPKKAAEFGDAQEKKIAEILDGEQQRRLGQILLQQQGYSALTNQDVANLLKLSEEQRKQVEAVTNDFGRTRKSSFSDGSRNRDEMHTRMAELRQEESKKLAALLTDVQKEQWRVLIGEPFELERRARDWRDSWESENWSEWRDYWQDSENWRGRSRPGSGGWRDRWGPQPKQGPER